MSKIKTGQDLKKIIWELLSICYILKKEICPACISKINSSCKKNNSLNVKNGGWHYLVVQKNYLHY